MIPPEEKIYSPETYTPQNIKDNGSKHLHLKKIIIAGSFVFTLIVAGGIVVIVTQNEDQSKALFTSQVQKCKKFKKSCSSRLIPLF